MVYNWDEERASVSHMSVVREFPNVFSEDLPCVPPMRQVEFKINLITSLAPIAKASYYLVRLEIHELSFQV